MAEAGDRELSPTSDDALLPEKGVKELADQLTEYMTRIELADIPDVLEQVLDDFLMQCGGIPDELDAPDAFDKIINNQLAVTLAFQLGRLAGRSPNLVNRFIQETFEKWRTLQLDNETEVTMEDFNQLAERVLPKLRRWRYHFDNDEETGSQSSEQD